MQSIITNKTILCSDSIHFSGNGYKQRGILTMRRVSLALLVHFPKMESTYPN